jgi:selenocysteine lyase/cysteine desulfurase
VVLPTQRPLFDIPDDVAYFNTAYNAPQLNESRDRLVVGAASKSRPWERKATDFFDDAETIRASAARLFGGDVDGYAVVPAASHALSAAARALEPTLSPGDEIVVLGEAFPSNYLPWKRTADETGAVIVTVPVPADGGWTDAVVAAIGDRTKAVAAAHCHWTDGSYVDLGAVGARCREVGAALAVDATQSLGAMPFDVDTIRPDFMAAAGYKWLLGPYGFGLFYVAEKWREARPLEETWLARHGAENFARLVDYTDVYRPGARRFDGGETCAASILPGAIAALARLEAWGVENIAETLAAINERVASHLAAHGFGLPDPAHRSPHMFGARLPEGFHKNVVAELAARSIYIGQRGDALRFAPHLHVDDRDVDRLLTALDEIVG